MITDQIIIAAVIAALCSCDNVAFGQFMLSRPIFCAPLFGYLSGDIGTGLWMGMIAETIWINTLPLGAAIPLDISALGILPVFWSAKYFAAIPHSAVFGLLLALPFAYLAKEIDILGRIVNTKLMLRLERELFEFGKAEIGKTIFMGLSLFFVKFFIFYVFAFYFGGWIFQKLYLCLPPFIIFTLSKLWYLLPALGFGSAAYIFAGLKLPFFRK
ncbi:MAG: PTS sugar transporter subunit IIC [Elusimicrobiota bacterium]|jgi:mannose/fructose/N-acetylgalactosamine-specific phosphotransferase system component IIC|nr:PTS sugar transporter subunit IIC [Elusimicrobiota bacterium]